MISTTLLIQRLLLLAFISCTSCNNENITKSKTITTGVESHPANIPAPQATTLDSFQKYEVNPADGNIALYWKDDKDSILRNFENLNSFLKSQNKELLFAMNAGMYMEDNSPLGLFIENGKTIRTLNTKKGSGNFHLQPNGVFYINKNNKAFISTTQNFKNYEVLWATQSGPMVLIDNKINTLFDKNSKNLNIRNGVGLTQDGKVVFVISNVPVSFYDFANYFVQQGCKDALYLDGAISNIYLKDKRNFSLMDNFGVMIGVTK